MKKKGKKKSPRYNKKHTKETKKKISRAMKGKKKSPETIEKMKGNTNAQVWDFETAKKLFTDLIDWLNADLQNVFIISFLAERKIHKSTLDYLIDTYDNEAKELRDLEKTAKTIQEARLVDLGFKNVGNPTITIFLLKNNHGYKDRYENDNTNNLTGGVEVKGALTDEQLAIIAKSVVRNEAESRKN